MDAANQAWALAPADPARWRWIRRGSHEPVGGVPATGADVARFGANSRSIARTAPPPYPNPAPRPDPDPIAPPPSAGRPRTYAAVLMTSRLPGDVGPRPKRPLEHPESSRPPRGPPLPADAGALTTADWPRGKTGSPPAGLRLLLHTAHLRPMTADVRVVATPSFPSLGPRGADDRRRRSSCVWRIGDVRRSSVMSYSTGRNILVLAGPGSIGVVKTRGRARGMGRDARQGRRVVLAMGMRRWTVPNRMIGAGRLLTPRGPFHPADLPRHRGPWSPW